jgi:hypothetical protein
MSLIPSAPFAPLSHFDLVNSESFREQVVEMERIMSSPIARWWRREFWLAVDLRFV